MPVTAESIFRAYFLPLYPEDAKTDLALVKTDQVIAAGARFGRVVADAGYGISAAFRRGLSERGLVWAVGIPKVQTVYSTAVELRWPTAATGRPRKHPVPSEEPVPAEQRHGAARLATSKSGATNT